jgi:RecA-family ATPase
MGFVPEPSGNGHAPNLDRWIGAANEESCLLVDMVAAMEAAKEPISFPLNPIAARGFLTVLAAKRDSFKSWLMLLSGHAVQRGDLKIAGMTCERTTVLYVDAENGARLMGRRFTAAGIPADGLLVADGTQLRLPGDIRRLGRLIGQTGAGLVVLDSLRRLAPGMKENESDHVAPIVAGIAELARSHNVAIVLIHHRSSKDGAATLRGSSSIEDQADLVFTLDRKGTVCKLQAAKFRIGEQPPPIWLRFRREGTRFVVKAAEPVVDDGTTKPHDAKAQQVLDALSVEVQAGREIARLAEVSEPSTRRILHNLRDEGLAEQQAGGWVRQVRHPFRGDAVTHPNEEPATEECGER